MNDFSLKYLVDENTIFKKFCLIWEQVIKNKAPSTRQQAFILGGQPGAGKSVMIDKIFNDELNGNAIIISGDDYRRHHPKYLLIQENEGLLSVKYTQDFSSKITQMLIQKASDEKYNLIVEGTFRTASTPLKTLEILKSKGYETHIVIIATPARISRASCLERYKKQFLAEPRMARFTDPSDHDVVVENIAKNVNEVFLSSKADFISLYTRDEILHNNLKFDNKNASEIAKNICKDLIKKLDLELYAKMKEFIAFNERKELKELSNAKYSQSINLEK